MAYSVHISLVDQSPLVVRRMIMKSILALFAMVLMLPLMAEAKVCDCRVGQDVISGRSYFQTICRRNQNGIPKPVVREYGLHSIVKKTSPMNVRYSGYDNTTVAWAKLNAYAKTRKIQCSSQTQAANQ